MSLLRVLALAAGVIGGMLGMSAHAAPAMWRVTGAGSEIYLFGTLHALQPNVAWRTPAYDAAYAKAGSVWFEVDLGAADPATIGLIVSRYGVDPERGLSEKLGAADLRALKGETPDMDRIEHLRPWAAALMLSMQPVLAKGATVETGADLTVTRQARDGGKTIRTFETLEDQARVFASLPEPAELQYLADVIHERRAPPKRLALGPSAPSLERDWLAGDLARLGPGLAGELAHDNPALYDVLLKRRNLAWADKLTTEMARSPGVELVNVGALHMVGPDGLPALLAARGFKVDRVQ
ncbi:TraB/GumN family protein [Phenylobacterium sp.]|jgi:hypothetical protein|uniref:TraB/GumN family protein n=1 Tax=Phenylobacterium sp. TaxID=1871053 RepID=UPI002E34BCF6|nr:TraB/GumN family protein [Phenylobacterium sp.]HEX3365150.1 TraB/GumN family protein [Phenylobacterium sp.]